MNNPKEKLQAIISESSLSDKQRFIWDGFLENLDDELAAPLVETVQDDEGMLQLLTKNIEDKNYKALLQYFNVIIDNVIGDNSNDYDTNYELVKSKIQQNDVSLKTWSFELLLDWNELSELSQIKRKQIKDLSDLFKN